LGTATLVAAVLVAGVGGTAVAMGDPESGSTSKGTARAKAAGGGAKVKLLKTRFGRILVTGKGLTLYLFDKEKTGQSECYADCATAWPPLLSGGKPVAGKDVKKKLLRTTTRTDGTRQVTYRGHPLYRYHTEDQAGEVLCQNVFEFGGLWLVVNRAGNAIR
jgi:predicted lipoprotein with Yx(FWY)xxD motif